MFYIFDYFTHFALAGITFFTVGAKHCTTEKHTFLFKGSTEPFHLNSKAQLSALSNFIEEINL